VYSLGGRIEFKKSSFLELAVFSRIGGRPFFPLFFPVVEVET